MPDVPPYSGASYDISPRDMGIGALITLGAFSAIGIGAFATGAVVATTAPLAPSITIGGLAYSGLTLAEAMAAEAALIAASQVPKAMLTPLVQEMIVKSAIAAHRMQMAGLLNAGGFAGLAAYGSGENAPAYDGLGGVLAYPSGNPLGDIHNLAAIGINTAAGTVNGVQFFVKFHCEAF